jgi:hypothetical protein
MNLFEKSIISLKNQRKVFHSEHDLKFSFAIALKENNPDFQIRLERPVNIDMVDRNDKKSVVRAPIDILIIDKDGNTIPIELKYKTKKANINCDGENYLLTEHGAPDTGRFSFRKDIYRIENYKSKHSNCKVGYVFILTNDGVYSQNNVFEKDNIDKYFSFHHGGLINRLDKSWNYESLDKAKYKFNERSNTWENNQLNKHWSCSKEYFYKLDLLQDYKVDWKEFSKIGDSIFKYCLIKVDIQ